MVNGQEAENGESVLCFKKTEESRVLDENFKNWITSKRINVVLLTSNFFSEVALFYREPDPIVSAKRKTETVSTVVPFFLDKFEALVEKNGGYFHGGTV